MEMTQRHMKNAEEAKGSGWIGQFILVNGNICANLYV